VHQVGNYYIVNKTLIIAYVNLTTRGRRVHPGSNGVALPLNAYKVYQVYYNISFYYKLICYFKSIIVTFYKISYSKTCFYNINDEN